MPEFKQAISFVAAKRNSSKTARTSRGESLWRNFAFFSIFSAFIIGIITWATDANSPQESLNPDPANSYYNLLVRGFQSGQLNMKVDTPPELAKLIDPYNPDHIWNSSYWANKLDTSYYKGKFYLYFGVTPALALFWPYAILTGHYLSARCAVAIFFALGFLAIGWLLCDVRQRYFPKTSFGAFAPGIFILGLVLCLTQSGSVYGLARVSGFTFVMLALMGTWYALHWSARGMGYLLLASLSYGLAIGSRPSLLFGAVILLVPALQTWFEEPGAASRRRAVAYFFSAVGPIILIGLGLMAYNDLRFGSPFEFGRRYQLTVDYESTISKQFSPHYLWFNIRYYFLEPISANGHFPFLQDFTLPSPPSGHAPESSECGSLLWNYPFMALIFALPLVWRNTPLKAPPALSWFILALFLLFATGALVDCCFLTVSMNYALDFQPPLAVLAFIGFLGVDRFYANLPGRRRLIRFGWYMLLGYSLAFNLFANIKARASSYNNAGDFFLDQRRPDDALKYFQNAASLDPRGAMCHNKLAIAYAQTGRADEALGEARKALAIDPNCIDAQYVIGILLYQKGRSDEAFKHFEIALNGDPSHTNTHFALYNTTSAWLIISNPDLSKRNGPLAIKLAEAACQETSYKNTLALLSSAAVFGETGRTNEAVAMAQKAVDRAKQDGDSNLLNQAELLLANYQQKPAPLPAR